MRTEVHGSFFLFFFLFFFFGGGGGGGGGSWKKSGFLHCDGVDFELEKWQAVTVSS